MCIPGTKKAGSAAVLRVDPELWPWVTAAVPAPLAYWGLRFHWKRALATAGADQTLRLHDLRHLTAQLLVNAGQTEASVQTTMRHETASMTRRYAAKRPRRRMLRHWHGCSSRHGPRDPTSRSHSLSHSEGSANRNHVR